MEATTKSSFLDSIKAAHMRLNPKKQIYGLTFQSSSQTLKDYEEEVGEGHSGNYQLFVMNHHSYKSLV
jgi:hypothetical protein